MSHDLFRIKKDSALIAGVACKGAGTASTGESAQTVSPQGDIRKTVTAVLSIDETLSFELEGVEPDELPAVGATGISSFTVERLKSGTGRETGLTCTAALTTVTGRTIKHGLDGKPAASISVSVESADGIASGLSWGDEVANAAPVAAIDVADQAATVGTPFTFTIPSNSFTDGDSDTLTWSVSTLPAGLAFTPATRVIAGTPTGAEVKTVTVTVNDGHGHTTAATFKITVTT